MKQLIFLIIFFKFYNVQAQDKFDIDELKNAKRKEDIEALFKHSIGRKLFKSLSVLDFGEESISKLYYYRYRIISKDSIVFQALNNPSLGYLDSIMKLAFYNTVDFYKKHDLLSNLLDENNTYIPVIFLYKTKESEKLHEKISINPFVNIFDWDFESDGNKPIKPMSIYRTFSPYIFRFPVQKSDYFNNKEN
jgi:hypothetical protein